MPDSHDIEAWATVALATLTLLTLGFTVLSFRHATRDQANALRTTAIQSISMQVMELGRWLTDHSEYREYLLLPVETDEQRTAREGEAMNGTAEAIEASKHLNTGNEVATVYADFIDHVLSQAGLLDASYMQSWEKWIEGRISGYPRIRQLVLDHPEFYGPRLRELAGVARTQPMKRSLCKRA